MVTVEPPGVLAHTALFYDSSEAWLAGVSGFVREGLDAGEPVLVAAPAGRLTALRAEFGELAERAAFTDMAVLGRNPGRIIPAVGEFAQAHAGRRVRLVSEPLWPGRTPAEIREATRHEALANLAFAATPAAILCLYDRAGLETGVLADARVTHPGVIEAGQFRPSADYGGGAVPAGCDQPLPDPPAWARKATFSARSGLAGVRALVSGCATAAGAAANRAGDVVLAVSELAANTLMHTKAGGVVHAWQAGGRLLCQIQDAGQITDPLAGRYRPDPATAGGGQGLWLVHQVCDLVEVRTGTGGTAIRVHIALRE